MSHHWFKQLAHMTMYFSYFCVAFCGYLESKRRVPADSFRIMIAMVSIGEYLIWDQHAMMKKGADMALHHYLAYVCLANAVTTAYSVRNTDSTIAYVISWSVRVLEGMWVITAGIYEGYVDMPMHDISCFLLLEACFLALLIVSVWAIFGPEPLEQDLPEFRNQFSPLDADGDYDLSFGYTKSVEDDEKNY